MAELTDVREAVRERYAAAARSSSGCSCSPADATGVFGGALYDERATAEVPESALNASLGCGVPTAVADLHAGEIVLDLLRRSRRPETASVRLSVNDCRTKRPRLAPRASRTELSPRRAAPRASSRLAMFAHVISRTIEEIPSSRASV